MQFDLPSGAKLDVTPLAYEKAWEIAQNAIRVFKDMDINVQGADLQEFLRTDIMSLKNPVCTLLTSSFLMPSVREAWTRCTYNGVKIDSMTFHSAEARGDFLFCAFYALKENILPFFAGLASFFQSQSTEIPTKSA